MENKAVSETLDKGFVESNVSETENPCNKVLEEKEAALLCNLGDNCSYDVYGGPVELTTELSNVGANKSKLCDGDYQISKWTSDNHSEYKLSKSMEGNNNFPVLEGDLNFDENDKVQIRKVDETVDKNDYMLNSNNLIRNEKFEETMEKGDHILHPHEPSSPTKMEVSGNGINLVVEVFGPLDGTSESNYYADNKRDYMLVDPSEGIFESNNNVNVAGEHVSGDPLDVISDSNSKRDDTGGHVFEKIDFCQEYVDEENDSLSLGVKNANSMNKKVDNVWKLGCTFNVGDLVWVKTRTELWWPGMVSDPSNDLKDPTKSEKGGTVLVKYFGNANLVWFSSSDLKPFAEYYERMVGQNSSRSFLGSVEKALCEFGRQVKSKMTCSCISKESKKLANQQSTENKGEMPMSMNNLSKSDVLSLSHFEPESFFARIIDLALSVSAPGKIEFTVMKNCLSAFYRSSGHQERLTLEIVDEGSNNNYNNAGGSRSVKSWDGDLTELRSEKTNHNDDADLAFDDRTYSSGRCSDSRERKKSKYLSYPYIDVDKGLKVASSLGEETKDLKHLSGLGGCSGTNSRKSESKKLFKGHRMHSQAKADDIDARSSQWLAELRDTARDCLSEIQVYYDSVKRFFSNFRKYAFIEPDTACEIQMEGIREMKEFKVQSINFASANESVNNTVSNQGLKINNLQAKGEPLRRRARKKEQVRSALSMSNSFSIDMTVTPSYSSMISFQGEDRATPGFPQVGMVSILPDLNGNHPSLMGEHLPKGISSTHLGKPFPSMAIAPVRTLKDMQVAHVPQMNNVDGLNSPNQFQKEVTHMQSVLNVTDEGLGLSDRGPLQTGPSPPVGKLKPRRRKRKEETCRVASVIPDSNGGVLETSSSGKTVPEGNEILSGGNVERKRRKKNSAGTESVQDPKTIRGSTNGPGSILLNFAPDTTPPSIETLVATFFRFGTLNQSETKFLNDHSAKIAYERSTEARFAFQSLEREKPFGASLASFDLQVDTASFIVKKKRNNFQMPQPFVPVSAYKVAKPGNMPEIAFIKHQVEIMKSTLEKSGDTISPEAKSKLENEIKCFMAKIDSMDGSASSQAQQ